MGDLPPVEPTLAMPDTQAPAGDSPKAEPAGAGVIRPLDLSQLDFDEPAENEEADARLREKLESAAKPPASGEGGGTDAAASPPPPPPPPPISDALKSRAKEAGYSDDDLKEFTSPKALERALDLMDRQLARSAAVPRNPAPATPPASAKPGEQPGTQAAEEFKVDLIDENEWAPELAKPFNKLATDYSQQRDKIAKLEATVQQLLAAESGRAAASTRQQIDSMFSSLGDEYAEVFGVGEGSKLGQNSPQFNARLDVLREMDALSAGYQLTGRTPPPPDELFRRAVRMLHGERVSQEATERAKRDVIDRLRNDQGQFVSRPTSRRETPRPGESAAAAAIRERMAQNGKITDEDDLRNDFL